ncbi:uncharacterized protein J7T54_002210 [Emericellopsis cladophorae]|uniref:BZIP domain-containing protein n=1 Tax=Emericellopsis cladophorae TaxID=2686198 RepID=A0A9P9Y4I1_9HYPO|nr:uncharacterized protein J7T54_002210 [Emericellopsis cladophorae]KAI6783048.1 hypothetical protein J7T54_002210 [Emericellopsis cladophorae]
MAGSESPPKIAIHGRVHDLPDLWDGKDDWTGVTSTAERKRRQNRLNQRAYRRRKRGASSTVTPPPTRDDEVHIHTEDASCLLAICSTCTTSTSALSSPSSNGKQLQQALVKVRDDEPHPWPRQDSQDGLEDDPETWDASIMQCTPHRVARIRSLIRQAYEDHALHAPRIDQLPILIRINVMNAMVRNAIRMGFHAHGLCHDDYLSPFAVHDPQHPSTVLVPRLPDALRPTDLQRAYAHHPWTDLFPFPLFRDNVLCAMQAGLLDEDELCADIMEVRQADVAEAPSLMIWGESWDAMAWEMTPAFIRKWGWLLRGCQDLMAATNLWRTRRGERALPVWTWLQQHGVQ